MAPADSMGIRAGFCCLAFTGKRLRRIVRYFSVIGMTTSKAEICRIRSACWTSEAATSLNCVRDRVRSYSRISKSTRRRLASMATTPIVLPLSPSMLSMEEPGGTMIITTPWVTSTTVRAIERSSASARTVARSTLPAENSLAASTAVGVSTILRRMEALVLVSRLAIAEMMRTASPSYEPAAIVSVVGVVR
jgi:hypothetical protein